VVVWESAVWAWATATPSKGTGPGAFARASLPLTTRSADAAIAAAKSEERFIGLAAHGARFGRFWHRFRAKYFFGLANRATEDRVFGPSAELEFSRLALPPARRRAGQNLERHTLGRQRGDVGVVIRRTDLDHVGGAQVEFAGRVAHRP
jgi:hypothetical protein